MIVYGYVKGCRYSGDGTLQIQVRVPNVHGAYQLLDYKGKKVRNYTSDADLPWYPSLLLPHMPKVKLWHLQVWIHLLRTGWL